MAKKTGFGMGSGLSKFIKVELHVLPELEAFIPPLSEVEEEQLEKSLINDGLKEPIEYWYYDDKQVVVDGHNRKRLLEKNNLSVDKTKEVKFDSLDEVKEYMLKKQLGRRNLSDANKSYLIGLLYNKSKAEKGRHERNNKASNKAEIIAKNTGSSVRSVKNAGEFASGLEKLVPELKGHILSGEKKVTKSDVQSLAKADVEKPIESVEQIKKEAKKVQEKKQTKNVNLKPVDELKRNAKEKGVVIKKDDSKEVNSAVSNNAMNDEDYLNHYMEVKDDFLSHFHDADELVLFNVLNDFFKLQSNLNDLVKLVNDGYTILRVADTPSIHIKHFTSEKNSWRTLENDFKSKAERDRRLKELLKDNKTIKG